MKKLIFMCAMIAMITGASVQAQKKPIQPIGPPVPFSQTINVEDDATGNFVVFNTGSGKYRFTRCSDGLTITGAGFVRVDGCSITLEDVQPDHRIVVSANECAQAAKAIVERFAPFPTSGSLEVAPLDVEPFKAFLSDSNLDNNLLDCAPKK